MRWKSMFAVVALAGSCLAAGTSQAQTTRPSALTAEAGWTPLFNGRDLEGWYTWLKDSGKNVDPTRIFQVHDGVVHIYKDAEQASNQPFGYIATNEEFGDCRIRLQYKWGTKRFGGRATKKRDSGLLYFTFGPDGPDGKTWPHSVECQIQESDTGDIFAIGTACSTTIDPATATEKAPTFKGSSEGGVPYTTPGKMNDRIIRSQMLENDDWNTVEVVLEGDSAVHIVNGKTNMKITRATRPAADKPGEWQPLRRGPIVLQAEGAEVMYRNIEIQPLKPPAN
jgi:hypothetical protein